jgi:hypothetical protein
MQEGNVISAVNGCPRRVTVCMYEAVGTHPKRSYGAGDEGVTPSLLHKLPMERPMKRNDLSRSLLAFDQVSTMVSVVELSFRGWLVAGLVPGLNRQPLKKLGADAQALLTLLRRWQSQATKAGGTIKRIVVAFEAGRDGLRAGCGRGGSRPM